MSNSKPKAVIYCHVSSLKQVTKGNELSSQETRCREYAGYKGYDVVAAFHDEGVSGGMINRPSMQEMLSYLKKNKKKDPYIVIIDDISRLARGLEAHIQLRTAIGAAGGKLESPSIEFGDDSDSRLVENLLASVSQHHRQKNVEQVKNRMRARVMNGYWTFYPPIGYTYKRVSGHGKMLVRDEPIASIIQQTFEGFASGRFETVAEVKRFLEGFPEYPRGKDGALHYQRIGDTLRKVIYAGYIDVSVWGISMHPAKHEPIVSFATWQKVQEKLDGKIKAPIKMNIDEDFPLRGFVTCGCCEKPMTACWSQGRTVKYPYYMCCNRGICPEYGRTVRKEKMEAEFVEILRELKPSPKLFYVCLELFDGLWKDRQNQGDDQKTTLKKQTAVIDRKIEQFLERVVEAEDPILIKTYESKVRKLQQDKAAIAEKVQMCGRPIDTFENTFRTAI